MATMDPKDLRQLEGYLAKHFPSVAHAGIEYATQSDDFLVLAGPPLLKTITIKILHLEGAYTTSP